MEEPLAVRLLTLVAFAVLRADDHWPGPHVSRNECECQASAGVGGVTGLPLALLLDDAVDQV
mgnify:CR=1 FL=1